MMYGACCREGYTSSSSTIIVLRNSEESWYVTTVQAITPRLEFTAFTGRFHCVDHLNCGHPWPSLCHSRETLEHCTTFSARPNEKQLTGFSSSELAQRRQRFKKNHPSRIHQVTCGNLLHLHASYHLDIYNRLDALYRLGSGRQDHFWHILHRSSSPQAVR